MTDLTTTDPARRPARRWVVPVVGGALAGSVLLGGGVALADGADPSTGSATTESPASTDGAPTPPSGAPTPPDGAPTPPSGAPAPGADAPAPPRGGPAGEASGDRLVGTLTAVSDSSLTVTDDQGSEHQLTRDADTRVTGEPGDEDSALARGERVEVRAEDGAAQEVHRVLAHVDGVVTAVDGDELTVVTTPGLHVQVDASGLDDVPAVGDAAHLVGTVTADGDTVTATGSAPGPR
jgi:hypothetical protein